MIFIVNGGVIGLPDSTSQRVELIHTYEDRVWIKSCGNGKQHLISIRDIQEVELTKDVSLPVRWK